MNSPIINIKELKEIMDNDMELIQDCFSDFIEEWPQIYDDIKQAVLTQNAENLDSSAHKLKGVLQYLAAQPAADAANILESAGKENKLKNLEDHVAKLKNECLKVEEYINTGEL